MINNIYSRYLAEFGVRPYSKYSSHKKNELHNIYSDIIRLSKSSPFYSINNSDDVQKTAIEIKESARNLAEISDEISDAISPDSTFNTVAISDRPDIVGAEYVGLDKPSDYSPCLLVNVSQLATPQTNTGAYMTPDGHDIPAGTYSFDVNISSITYELQFTVKNNDTNGDVQNKIARLINKSNIGIQANVKSNGLGQSALTLTSKMTGVGNEPCIFNISDSEDNDANSITGMLKLDYVSHYPSNAVFTVNGNTCISTSNNYTVDGEFALTFNNISPDNTPVHISLKANTAPVIGSIRDLADSYNRLTMIAAKGTGYGSKRLCDELKSIAAGYSDTLNTIGIAMNEEGYLHVDEDALRQASDESSLLEKVSQIETFKNKLKNKASAVMLNPMEYINKTIISYKNPARPTSDPYTTSIYSGMMYNGYC